MKKEAIAHGVWEDLANRNDNWDKLDGVPEKVNELDEGRLTLKNEIVNGSFENDMNNWEVLPSSGSSIELTDKVIGDKSYKRIGAGRVTQSISVPTSNKIYASFWAKRTVANTGASVIARLKKGGIEASIPNTVSSWGKYSLIDTGVTMFYIGRYATENGEYLVDGVMVIDLTTTYGAGNEPTKEEMDIIMDTIGYFNGNHTITSKEQFNILLKMVRNNTLATTSLGGGF